MSKILITCAVTGSIHTPSMSPYLPVTPTEICDQARGAAEAGAAILHLHARNPQTGQPSAREEDFMSYLPQLKQSCDAVLNLSTGGSAVMTLDERLAAPKRVAPEMCSLNMGSMNFALYPAAARISEWKHGWEQPFLENSDDLVFKNTPRDIARILTELGVERGARFEFECYDVWAFLYAQAFCGSRIGAKASVYPVRVWGAGRHGDRSGKPDAYEGDRRQTVWR